MNLPKGQVQERRAETIIKTISLALNRQQPCTVYDSKHMCSRDYWRVMVLTGHWQWRSFWKDLWVKGQSQSLSGTGKIPASGCEESLPVTPDQNQDWPGSPGGCGPLTIHSPHQNYEEREKETGCIPITDTFHAEKYKFLIKQTHIYATGCKAMK